MDWVWCPVSTITLMMIRCYLHSFINRHGTFSHLLTVWVRGIEHIRLPLQFALKNGKDVTWTQPWLYLKAHFFQFILFGKASFYVCLRAHYMAVWVYAQDQVISKGSSISWSSWFSHIIGCHKTKWVKIIGRGRITRSLDSHAVKLGEM